MDSGEREREKRIKYIALNGDTYFKNTLLCHCSIHSHMSMCFWGQQNNWARAMLPIHQIKCVTLGVCVCVCAQNVFNLKRVYEHCNTIRWNEISFGHIVWHKFTMELKARISLVSFVINSSEILHYDWCDTVLIFKYYSFRNTLLQTTLVFCLYNVFVFCLLIILWIILMLTAIPILLTQNFGIFKCLQLNQIHEKMRQFCCKFPWNVLWQSWNFGTKTQNIFSSKAKCFFFNQFFLFPQTCVGRKTWLNKWRFMWNELLYLVHQSHAQPCLTMSFDTRQHILSFIFIFFAFRSP